MNYGSIILAYYLLNYNRFLKSKNFSYLLKCKGIENELEN